MAEKPKCPSCGGEKVVTIKHQGETYYQCMTPRPEKRGPCKFWSTKWRPQAG